MLGYDGRAALMAIKCICSGRKLTFVFGRNILVFGRMSDRRR